jgi:glycosyltransferase involved in cell wall biosynthesis
MRILHVIPAVDPLIGGPAMTVFGLGAESARIGHKVSVCSYSLSSEGRGRFNSVWKSQESVAFHEIGPISKIERWLARNAKRLLLRLIEESDLVHIHGLWEPLLIAAADVCAATNTPYAVTLHGMLNPWTIRRRWMKKRLSLALGTGRMLRRAAFLHCLNEHEATQSATWSSRTRRVIVPNGVFTEEFEPSEPNSGNRSLLLFLGRLEYKKGLDLLIDAFATVDSQAWQLVIAGPDYGVRAALARQIAQTGMRDRISLREALYGEEKLATLRSCSAFILPSREEGFSIAVLEAMAAEKPVILTDRCHFDEIVSVGAGFVVPCTRDGIASALQKVFSNSIDLPLMGACAKHLVTTRYTWPIVTRLMVNAYQSVVASG